MQKEARKTGHDVTIEVQEPVERDGELREEVVAYELRFDWNMACVFERHSGKVLSQVLDEIGTSQFSAVTARALVWAALRERHPDVSIERAGHLVARIGWQPTLKLLGDALAFFFPEEKSDAPEESDVEDPAGAIA